MQWPKVSDVVATVLALGVLAAVWGAVQWAPGDTLRWLLAGAAVLGAAALVMWGLLGPGSRWLAGEHTEGFYNRRGRHSALDYMTPQEFETTTPPAEPDPLTRESVKPGQHQRRRGTGEAHEPAMLGWSGVVFR
ncbi:hypothetical protein [Actinomadura rudentiformis]|uniref:Uncharacterized protein n=1 Tax=Actinomadura rudentiformis TaxID=359158 RepID=A0A6H9YXL3_9ACTN|nr:hypothetical protein [Actinomadura rudentiformis]KAB2352194.1 hypothetical protein F8566_00295 [Actinomadura rudentiformis]